MNLLDLYKQFKSTKQFNSADIKGTINVQDYTFDIRLVNGDLYANGLLLADFMDEAMLSIEDEIAYEEAIYNWLHSISNFQVA